MQIKAFYQLEIPLNSVDEIINVLKTIGANIESKVFAEIVIFTISFMVSLSEKILIKLNENWQFKMVFLFYL